MSQPKLPLRVKVDVRDRFESLDSVVQRALRTLENIVGLKTLCSVDWEFLYNALESQFSDKSLLVPTIADVVVAWCDVFSTRLEDDKFSSWTEDVLSMIQAPGNIHLQVQVSSLNPRYTSNQIWQALAIDRPRTTWSTAMSCFLLSLPSKSSFSPQDITSGFETDFSTLLTNEPSIMLDETAPLQSGDGDWAELDVSDRDVSLKPASLYVAAIPDRLPSATTLPSPDILLCNSIPYILHVTKRDLGKVVEHGSSRSFSQGQWRHTVGQTSNTQIEHGGSIVLVQATHSPSLQFLHDYLQRWVKRDHQDTRKCPLLRISLQQSHFGPSMYNDTLVIEPYDVEQGKRGVEMNPTFILALVENVLGYQRLPSTSAVTWEFRRDTAFR